MEIWGTALVVMQRRKGIYVRTLEFANTRTQRFKEVLHTIFHLILVRPVEGSWGMSKRTLVSHCRAWLRCHIVLWYPHCLASPHNDHRCYRCYRCPTNGWQCGHPQGVPRRSLLRHARHARHVPLCLHWCRPLTPIDTHCPTTTIVAIVAIVAQQWMAMRAPTRGAPTIIVWRWAAMFAMPHMASQRSLFPRPPCWPHTSRFASRASRLHAANPHDLCVFAPLRLCLKNGSRPQRREARTQQAHRCWRLLLHLQCPEVRIKYTARCEPGQQQAIAANIITRRGDQAKA